MLAEDKLESVAEDVKKTYSVQVKTCVMDALRHKHSSIAILPAAVHATRSAAQILYVQ